MSTYSDRIEKHKATSAYEEVKATLNDINSINNLSANDIDNLLHIEYTLNAFSEAFQNCDKKLIASSWLDKATLAFDKIKTNLTSYKTTSNSNYIEGQMQQYIDSLLDVVVSLTMAKPHSDDDGATPLINNYHNTIEKYIKIIKNNERTSKEQIATIKTNIEQGTNDLQSKITELADKISSEQMRLDKLSQYFNEQTRSDMKGFEDMHDAALTNFENAKNQFLSDVNKLIEEYESALTNTQKKADEILGVVNNNTFSYQYGKVANKARISARLWNTLAVVAMIIASIGVFFFAFNANQDTAIFPQLAKIVATTFIGSLAAYAGNQASKQNKFENYARKMELTMVAIDPYLLSLEESQKQLIKERLAYQLFKPSSVDKITDNNDPSPDVWNKILSVLEDIRKTPLGK